MARPNADRTALELQRVRRRIEVWRWTRLKRSPMPEDLWSQATKLADAHGVWRAARDLGLCYESLRRRVEERASRRQADAVRFVEVRGTELMDQSIERFLRHQNLWAEPRGLAEARPPPYYRSVTRLRPSPQVELFE